MYSCSLGHRGSEGRATTVLLPPPIKTGNFNEYAKSEYLPHPRLHYQVGSNKCAHLLLQVTVISVAAYSSRLQL